MSLRDVVTTMAETSTLLQVVKEVKPRPSTTRDCFAARVERTTARFPNHTAVIFEGRSLTWQELNAQANRYAGALRTMGLVRGDTVSLIMENRIEFLAAIIAMNKLGIIAALINTNLTGKPLVHCMNITSSRLCIFGEEQLDAVAQVRTAPELKGIESWLFVSDTQTAACPDWAQDFDEEAAGKPSSNPPQTSQNTLADTALYIYTSGTTGLPKASVISNRRYLLAAAMSYKGGLKCKENDCIYLCLPLYHGTGLFLGVGASFSTGAAMFIRRKFSGSNFLKDVRESGATCFIYIGELCRYLLNTPQQADDHCSPLISMMGNGLRPDVWHEFKSRFGIKRVAEFYGSSEGNVAFVNMLNKDCTVGTTSIPIALVKYDVDADEIARDEKGNLIKVASGEPGLLLGKITEKTAFEGYTSKEDTEKKILRDVFKPGDAWFNTGDLMKTVDVGFSLGLPHYQFVDRIGDTFRWKSENVSTNEVGEIINGHPQIDFCNVYGVEIPKADGKAGMASLVLAPGVDALDVESFSSYVNEHLPGYARPVFLRIQRELDTTGTFKMVKGDLRKQAYDLNQISDPVYVLKPRTDTYVLLDKEYAEVLRAGKAGY
ncbi:Long-chain-fatty-acid--CoA ligase FadD17 [Halioglobus japonicus]|nr:Long-chain-fatty-acid--CoA ligase FadD17 [Halioglobus japonicus]